MRKESCVLNLYQDMFFFLSVKRYRKMTRSKPPRQILTLRTTTQRSKFIHQERIPMFNAQILSNLFCSLSLFVLFCFVFCFFFCSLNTWLKNIILSLVPQYKYYLSHIKNIYHLYFLDLFLLFLHSGESIYQLPCLKFIKSQLNWIKHKFTFSHWCF